jgi:cobalt/nickel transport system permease protein
MLLVRSYDRADRVFQAMLCRGFHGVFYSLKTFSWQRRDWLFLVTSLLALIVIFLLEWSNGALACAPLPH